MTYFIMFVFGIIIGIGVGWILYSAFLTPKNIGELDIDVSDEEPYFFLRMSDDPRTIMHEKKVQMSVVVKKFISQK